jgi:hypothetical protein
MYIPTSEPLMIGRYHMVYLYLLIAAALPIDKRGNDAYKLHYAGPLAATHIGQAAGPFRSCSWPSLLG